MIDCVESLKSKFHLLLLADWKLIAEQVIRSGAATCSEERMRRCVKDTTAVELEYCTVKTVRSGLRDKVHDTTRVQPVSRGQRACIHGEFLKRIGKREGYPQNEQLRNLQQ